MTCHSQELCESLKMQNNKACYKRMRLEILAMAQKYLDSKLSCSMQEEAIQALKDELATRWPDFFGADDDGNKNALKRALAYIRQQHSSTRSRIKFTKVKNTNPTTNANLPLKQEVLEPQSNASTQTPLVERMARNLDYYSTQGSPSTSAESSGPSASVAPAPSEPHPRVRPIVGLTKSEAGPSFTTKNVTTTATPLPTRINTQNSQSSSEATSSSQASLPQSCLCQSPRQAAIYRSIPSTPDCSNPMNVQSIHQFLRTCLPPMDHFLYRFINAGLRTEEGLLGASRWTQELLSSFVDQLPPHADGSPVLLMEKMVLLHQFATYFL